MAGSRSGRVGALIDAALEASVIGSFGSTGIRLRRRLGGWAVPLPGTGRRVLVTGANRGLGLATVQLLLAAGAEVIATVRDPARSAGLRSDALDAIPDADRAAAAGRLHIRPLDLDDLGSVRALASTFSGSLAPDVLVHNAGAMFPTRELSRDGLERTYQVHVLAPFLLTELLIPELARREDPRVILVSSGGMYLEPLVVRRLDSPRGYRPAVAYARAKRAQVELTAELHRRLAASTGIAFHAMHPGWVRTDGLRSSLPLFTRLAAPILRRPAEGADTSVMLALAPRGAEGSDGGRLWHDRRVRPPTRLRRTACDDLERSRLWDRLVIDAGVDPAR